MTWGNHWKPIFVSLRVMYERFDICLIFESRTKTLIRQDLHKSEPRFYIHPRANWNRSKMTLTIIFFRFLTSPKWGSIENKINECRRVYMAENDENIHILLQSFTLPLFKLLSFELIYTKICWKSTQMILTLVHVTVAHVNRWL